VSSIWPHIRAALILGHLVAITAMALPSTSKALNKAAWKDPTVKAELRGWASALNQVGLSMTPAELEGVAFGVARRWHRAQKAVLSPMQPYYDLVGTRQAWQMFVAPHRHPSVLHVDVREHGQWRTVFQARSPVLNWRARELNQVRMRSVVFLYAWPGHRADRQRLATWLAKLAAEDHPQADALRLRYRQQATPRPGERRRAEEGKWRRETIVEVVH